MANDLPEEVKLSTDSRERNAQSLVKISAKEHENTIVIYILDL